MPALKNPKWERFAQCIADGDSNADAYRTAGFAAKNAQAAASGGSRLRDRDEVRNRIVEISTRREAISQQAETIAMTRAVEKLALSKERVLNELARLGFADIRRVVKFGRREVVADIDAATGVDSGEARITNSVELINSEALDDDTAAAIIEVKQGANGAVSVKMADKRAALMNLAQIMGMVVERKEIGGAGDFDGLTDDELRAIVEGRASATGARQEGAGAAEPTHTLHGTGKPH